MHIYYVVLKANLDTKLVDNDNRLLDDYGHLVAQLSVEVQAEDLPSVTKRIVTALQNMQSDLRRAVVRDEGQSGMVNHDHATGTHTAVLSTKKRVQLTAAEARELHTLLSSECAEAVGRHVGCSCYWDGLRDSGNLATWRSRLQAEGKMTNA